MNTVEYTMFIGLNDKDTREQEISDEAAIATVRSVLGKYADGYTLMNAQGGRIR